MGYRAIKVRTEKKTANAYVSNQDFIKAPNSAETDKANGDSSSRELSKNYQRKKNYKK